MCTRAVSARRGGSLSGRRQRHRGSVVRRGEQQISKADRILSCASGGRGRSGRGLDRGSRPGSGLATSCSGRHHPSAFRFGALARSGPASASACRWSTSSGRRRALSRYACFPATTSRMRLATTSPGSQVDPMVSKGVLRTPPSSQRVRGRRDRSRSIVALGAPSDRYLNARFVVPPVPMCCTANARVSLEEFLLISRGLAGSSRARSWPETGQGGSAVPGSDRFAARGSGNRSSCGA
jgi:hypothetical protein